MGPQAVMQGQAFDESIFSGFGLMGLLGGADKLLGKNPSLMSIAVYAVLAGVLGTLLLVLFLGSLIPLPVSKDYVGWIVGFNTTLSGYALLDKANGRISYQRAGGAAAGLLNALISFGALYGLSLHFRGESLFSLRDFLLFLAIGTACGGMGGVLAVKYHRLKR